MDITLTDKDVDFVISLAKLVKIQLINALHVKMVQYCTKTNVFYNVPKDCYNINNFAVFKAVKYVVTSLHVTLAQMDII